MNFKCNYRKCRKELNDTAVVTSCSHIFCMDHNPSKLISNNSMNNVKRRDICCPVCKAILGGSFDFVEVDLQPPDTFKGMVLTGLKPETIIEITARALGFWMYQMEQELQYNQYIIKKYSEKSANMENEFMKAYSSISEEKSILINEKENLIKECEELREKLIAESRIVEKLTSERNQLNTNESIRHGIKSIDNSGPNVSNIYGQRSFMDQMYGQHNRIRDCKSQPQAVNRLMDGKSYNNMMNNTNVMFISPDSTLHSPHRASTRRDEANKLWGIPASQKQPRKYGLKSARNFTSPLDNILNKKCAPMIPNLAQRKAPNSIESMNSSQLSFGFN